MDPLKFKQQGIQVVMSAESVAPPSLGKREPHHVRITAETEL
jgi:hypothetical protein